FLFFFSSRRRHTRFSRDWSSDVCSSDLAVFLLGILWKRVNATGAITTLMAGLFLLILRLGSEIYYQPQLAAGETVSGFLFGFASVNFAHMAIFFLIFSIILCIKVSLASSSTVLA